MERLRELAEGVNEDYRAMKDRIRKLEKREERELRENTI